MKTKSVIASLSFVLSCASSSPAETVEWIRQIGTHETDKSYGVSADGLGNVYITGSTFGSLEGTNDGGFDTFLSKYTGGTLQWTRQRLHLRLFRG